MAEPRESSDADLRVVGVSHPRLDAVEKVTGRATYMSDMQVPDMLYARILGSPVPHARLRRVDSSAALEMPGVRSVVTGADLTDIDPYYGAVVKDQPILALDTVRFQGEPVAVVVATDPEAAEEALEQISLEFDELPSAYTLDEALADDAPVLHGHLRPAGRFKDVPAIDQIPGTNTCHHYAYREGDVEQAFAQADHVFEDVYELPAVHHYPLEPYVVIARADRSSITVWSPTQHPFHVRQELAEIFGIPLARIRIVVPKIGGGFGCKCYTRYEPLTACLARAVERPVQLVTTVQESFLTLTRHGARTRVKTGVRADGTLVAREVAVHLDTGAYADVGPRVAKRAGFRVIGPYRVPNLQIDSYAVYTNKIPAGAYRGYGGPQGVWAVESQMDDIAARLGIDPLELRLKNVRRKGDDYVPGDTPLDGELRVSLERVAERVGWTTPSGGQGRGKGVALAVKDAGGAHTFSSAAVRVHADGSTTVLAGSVEFGQGAQTVLAQITAEVLGLPLQQVSVAQPDTAVSPYDQGSSASRTTVMMGRAVLAAARHVREQLLEIAAEVLSCPTRDIVLSDGRVCVAGRAVPLPELLAEHFGTPFGEVIGRGVYPALSSGAGAKGSVEFWAIAAGAAEVGVDPETGELTLHRYVSATDVGKAINPLQTEGQDEGAAMQALGHTIFEALTYEAGQLLNGNLVDYRVPCFADLPLSFETMLVEQGDGPGPWGAKGMGESGVLCVAPAIGNALYRAAGIRLRQLPLTPEAVWNALGSGVE